MKVLEKYRLVEIYSESIRYNPIIVIFYYGYAHYFIAWALEYAPLSQVVHICKKE